MDFMCNTGKMFFFGPNPTREKKRGPLLLVYFMGQSGTAGERFVWLSQLLLYPFRTAFLNVGPSGQGGQCGTGTNKNANAGTSPVLE